MKPYQLLYASLAVLLMLALASCSSKEPTAAQRTKRDQLAHAFAEEVRDEILPIRSSIALLYAEGFLISQDEQVIDLSLVEEFLELYESGSDCAITICFVNKGFVVARLQIVDGTGYYLRHEYDEREAVSVTGKVFDAIQVDRNERLNKIMITLLYDNNSLGTFTFRALSD